MLSRRDPRERVRGKHFLLVNVPGPRVSRGHGALIRRPWPLTWFVLTEGEWAKIVCHRRRHTPR